MTASPSDWDGSNDSEADQAFVLADEKYFTGRDILDFLYPPGVARANSKEDKTKRAANVVELAPVREEHEEQSSHPLEGVKVVPLEDFVDVEEPGAEAFLGEAGNAVIPGGSTMFYGPAGAGKTTLTIDFAFHVASGKAWLGMAVSRPLRVLLVENEGPRPLFRRKLHDKARAWEGPPVEDCIVILETPWADFTFQNESWREALTQIVRENEIDVVIAGPVTRTGMNEAGTLQDVRDFSRLIDDVRERSGGTVAIVLVHHENRGGQVSGAWEPAVDTLFHVQPQGHGRLRLYVEKARWATDYHMTTLGRASRSRKRTSSTTRRSPSTFWPSSARTRAPAGERSRRRRGAPMPRIAERSATASSGRDES
jgi:hypothetical protein